MLEDALDLTRRIVGEIDEKDQHVRARHHLGLVQDLQRRQDGRRQVAAIGGKEDDAVLRHLSLASSETAAGVRACLYAPLRRLWAVWRAGLPAGWIVGK